MRKPIKLPNLDVARIKFGLDLIEWTNPNLRIDEVNVLSVDIPDEDLETLRKYGWTKTNSGLIWRRS